jgi:hypothetical protein
MTLRTNYLTAMMVDYAVILLPLIGTHEAERMMARQGVLPMIAARVLAEPSRRRPLDLPPSQS